MTENEKTSGSNVYNTYCNDTSGDVAEVHTGYIAPATMDDGYVDGYDRGLADASYDVAHVVHSFCAALIGGILGTWIARNVLKN